MVLPILLFAHGKVKHDKKNVEKKEETSLEKVYKDINVEYLKSVKSIFNKNCFSCHTTVNDKKNKYYNLSKAASIHVNLSKDYPFIGHQTPLADLESISYNIRKDMMPPDYYTSKLTDNEKKIVTKWIKDSISKIEKASK